MFLPTKSELEPGTPAPESGTYELLNVAGSASGTRVELQEGNPLPQVPRAWTWRLVRPLPQYH